MIDRNTHFVAFKDLTMNSSNTAVNQTLPSHENEVKIPMVEEDSRESESD